MDRKHTLPFAWARRAIDGFLRRSPSAPRISLTGGEPLLALSTVERIIDYARSLPLPSSRRPFFSIVTNGLHLSPRVARFLKERRVEVKISMDGGPGPQGRFRKDRRGRSSYPAAARAVSVLKAEKMILSASMVVTPDACRNLVDHLRHLRRLGFQRIDPFLDITAVWDEAALRDLAAGLEEFAGYYGSLLARGPAWFFSMAPLFWYLKPKAAPSLACDKICLFPDGWYYACDKALALPFAQRKHYRVGWVMKGIDATRRRALLKAERGTAPEGGACASCSHLGCCYCPGGLRRDRFFEGTPWISRGPNGFCAAARLYLGVFERIAREQGHQAWLRRAYGLS